MTAPRARAIAPVQAVLGCLAFLIAIQFALLGKAVDGFLAGRDAVLWPAAAVSGACCGVACWLSTLLSPPRLPRVC